GLLEDVIAVRLGEKPKSGLSEDLASDELEALRSLEPFPGERVILGELRDSLRTPPEGRDRFDHLVAALRNTSRSTSTGPPPKCVVFTSSSRACREILVRLRARFGESAVEGYHRGLGRAEVERALARFRIHPGCFVLVCDRAGEEGRNLQFADRVIHFDVPLSPNRMEQRIGRLDRIGRDRPVRSTIFMGPACEHSLYEAWYRVLDEGFRVFAASI